jgi:hypothetical protein
MSCYNNYLPQPSRDWSRVQNTCVQLSISEANKIAMLNKGNVLQYKANSSNLTKAQKYSKIAKGQWINRNTTWATQSARGYTNPNTTSLKRTGNVVNVALNPISGAIIGPTLEPLTCPLIPINSKPLVIQDGGVLICSVQENVCTGETKSTLSQKLCNPTTDSDVPGQIQDLCWNDGTQTWFPRQRYIMTNSGNKFPYNYKFV